MSHPIYSLVIEDAPSDVISLGDGGKRFRKQIVKFGDWVDPHNRRNKMVLDRKWGEQVLANFKSKVVGRIPVPVGHPLNPSDLAAMNKGELVDVELADDGVYGVLDIRDGNAAKAIEEDLLWDVSIHFDPNYLDKASGKDVGPALLHVGLLTDPYLKGMAPFQALSNQTNAVMLSESKEYQMSALKNDREFDVTVKFDQDGESQEVTIPAGEEVDVPDEALEAAQKQVADAQAPESPAEPETPAEPENKPELSDRQTELEAENTKLRTELAEKQAEATYQTLLSDGRIVPAQEAAFKQLATVGSQTVSLSDGSTKSLSDLVTDFIKAGPKLVSFGEEGADGEEAKTPWDDLSDEEQAGSAAVGVSKEQYNEVHSAAV